MRVTAKEGRPMEAVEDDEGRARAAAELDVPDPGDDEVLRAHGVETKEPRG
jgi:hypothetical protein